MIDKNEFNLEIGQKIRDTRLAQNLSQAKLAELARMRQAAISDIETGKREISLREMINICVVLKKPLTSFIVSLVDHEWITDDFSEGELTLIKLIRQMTPDDCGRILNISRSFIN